MNKIITIAREFGSGGRELGKRIAEELGIAYYDKEIIQEVTKKTELAEEYVQQIIEDKPYVYYPIHIAHSLDDSYSSINSINEKIYIEQTNVIKELAEKSSCVIVGRCADYILRDLNPFRIYVYADMESKIKRCKEKKEFEAGTSDKKIAKMIKKIDKNRKRYYQFYTTQEWGDKLNYDICINTSGKSVKETVLEILSILK